MVRVAGESRTVVWMAGQALVLKPVLLERPRPAPLHLGAIKR